ncbi:MULTISPECIES: ComEC/Rec2 family competence protein [unclassified Iodidimonas]|uniref:ComEC/Rec2 family competence protein n=1 Tax=unclassified Iodidimonas TaxID=2626145 RepID=UPI0024822C88|nr:MULTISPECIES: ComEC/Rec2 family competence protein [unclassified Iodidimonas]
MVAQNGRPFTPGALLVRAISLDREAFILWSPVLMGCGIGVYFASPFEIPVIFTGLACLLSIALLILSRGVFKIMMIATLIMISGLMLAQWRSAQVAAPVLSESTRPIALSGQIARIEPQQGTSARFTLNDLQMAGFDPHDTPQKIRVTVRTQFGEAKPGDRVSFRAILNPPPEPVIPDGFDFARDAYFKGIGAVGFAVSDVAITGRATEFSILSSIEGLRYQLADRVRQRLGPDAGPMAAALLTGMRSTIADEDVNAMRVAGLAHLLAISGLHIGLVTMVAFFVLRAGIALVPAIALRLDGRKLAAIGAWMIALGYFLLSGATIPTQRAFLMTSVILLALLMGRQPFTLRLVAFSAFITLLFSPEALLSPSFQMSFAAVTALVGAYEILAGKSWLKPDKSRFGRRIAFYFLGVSLTTIIAEIAIAPFAAYHFNQFTSYGLLANLVAVPLMAFVVMPAGLLALILMPLGLEGWALDLMGLGVSIILKTAHQVTGLPGAEWIIPALPTMALVFFVMAGLCLFLWRQMILRLLSLPLLLMAAALAASQRPPDLLISRDADLFGATTVDGLAVSSLSKARYSREQWTRATGAETAFLWNKALMEREAGKGRAGRPLAQCDAMGCTMGTAPNLISIAFTPEALREDCHKAHILLAAIPVWGACPIPDIVIDRFDVWRDGAHALWIDGGNIKIRSVREARGNRPWVRNRQHKETEQNRQSDEDGSSAFESPDESFQ